MGRNDSAGHFQSSVTLTDVVSPSPEEKRVRALRDDVIRWTVRQADCEMEICVQESLRSGSPGGEGRGIQREKERLLCLPGKVGNPSGLSCFGTGGLGLYILNPSAIGTWARQKQLSSCDITALFIGMKVIPSLLFSPGGWRGCSVFSESMKKGHFASLAVREDFWVPSRNVRGRSGRLPEIGQVRGTEQGWREVSPAAVPASSSVPASRTVACRHPGFSHCPHCLWASPLHPGDIPRNTKQTESSSFPLSVCYWIGLAGNRQLRNRPGGKFPCRFVDMSSLGFGNR